MNSARVYGIEQHDADVDLVERGRSSAEVAWCGCSQATLEPFLPQQSGDTAAPARSPPASSSAPVRRV